MRADVTRRGSIEIKTYARSKRVIRLVACPFCEHTFEHKEPRWRHFLEDHEPEDAGLSPIEEPTPELVTDGGELLADSARSNLKQSLWELEQLGDEHADARYHVREAIGLVDAAQEVDQ